MKEKVHQVVHFVDMGPAYSESKTITGSEASTLISGNEELCISRHGIQEALSAADDLNGLPFRLTL